MNFCPSCGSKLAGASPRFCGQCGSSVPYEESTPTGGAAWSEPTSISLPGHSFSEPQIAVDISRNATLVWNAFDGTTSRAMVARFVDGRWTTPRPLSNGRHRASDVRVAVDYSGITTAVWLEFADKQAGSVQACRYVDGAWTTQRALSAPGVDAVDPSVIIDERGVATVVWRDMSGRGRNGRKLAVQASRFESGSWTSPVDISDASVTSTRQQVAACAGGEVIVMWEQINAESTSLYATSYKGNKWAKPILVSGGDSDSQSRSHALAASPRGDVVAIWREGPDQLARTRGARFVDGSWAMLDDVPAPDGAWGQSVAVDPLGVITALWRTTIEEHDGVQGEDQDEDRVLCLVQVSRHTDGAWTPPVDLCLCGERYDQKVAADSRGRVTAVWEGVQEVDSVVQSSRFADGEWSPVVTLSSPIEEATSPQLAIDASDNVLATWDLTSGWTPTGSGQRVLRVVQVSQLEVGS